MGKFVCILSVIFLTFVYQSVADISDTTCDPDNNGDETCQTVDQNADCPADTTNCACKADFFFSSDKTKCEKKITTIACTYNDDTLGDTKCQLVDTNSECQDVGGKCACKAGYAGIDFCTNVITDVTCIPNDATCQDVDTNAECPADSTTCACTNNHFLSVDKRQCVQSIEEITCTPSDVTDGNTKCETQDPNTECPTDSTTCKCKADHFLSSDKKQCVQSIEEITCTPGEAGDTKCQTEDESAECHTSSTCVCKADYFLTSDKKTCKQKITTVGCSPGTAGNIACGLIDGNSECPDGGDKCACKDGYAGTDSCARVITDITCTPGDTTCQTEDSNAECPAGSSICACKDGYVLNSDKTQCVQSDRSSATSAWMTTSLIVTALLIYLPVLVYG